MRSILLSFFFLLVASTARADVVPPYDCGPGKVWVGGHSGDCEWGMEPRSMVGVGGCCGSVLCFGSVTALIIVFVRRKKPQVAAGARRRRERRTDRDERVACTPEPSEPPLSSFSG